MKTRATTEVGPLPRPADELEDLAEYYGTHDTAEAMVSGEWVDPRPMRTTSLRLPAEIVESLKVEAHRRGIRYTALIREILEQAERTGWMAEKDYLAQINERLTRIEATVALHDATVPNPRLTQHRHEETDPV
jgi:predicted DNA-binding protein